MKETVGRSVGMLSNLIRRHFSTFSFHDTLSGTQGKTLHFILARGQECDVFQIWKKTDRSTGRQFLMMPA